MKRIFILIGLIVFLLACDDGDVQKGIPSCIQDKIEDIKAQDVWNPPAKIYSYQYEGETVYYFTARCCDIMSELYDEKCNLICAPDGGIAGNGDEKCPNFIAQRANEKLIWEDTRN
jgi:hypothetical protein